MCNTIYVNECGGQWMNKVNIERFDFNRHQIAALKYNNYNHFPLVYILHHNARRTAYIGESSQIRNRLNTHLRDRQKKKLDEVLLISHKEFHRSATYNIETNLINYFIADQKYQLLNKSQITQSVTHNYYNKQRYHHDIFAEIWEQLKQDALVDNTIEQLQNKDIFKLSPYKELSESQMELKGRILEFCKKHIDDDGPAVFFIHGEAGTGKSVVLSSTFNALQDLSKEDDSPFEGTENHLLVNHQEMLKTYKAISESLPNLKKKNFMKPTPFINATNKGKNNSDITLVDEAHLLLSRADKFNDYHGENQLKDIVNSSKISIVVFDEKQFLKLKSYWSQNLLAGIGQGEHVERYRLTDQFRIQANPAVVDWIDDFVNKKVKPIPYSGNDYELKVFNHAGEMFEAIKDKDEKYQLSRVVATFDYEHKKDGGDYYVEEPGFKGIWNQTHYKETWAEHPETIKEVGSIYTVQGFDLNYVGVILGPSISFDEDKKELKILTENYKDKEAFRTSNTSKVEYNTGKSKEQIILNSINVLMKRGVKGLYIYASDEKLRKALNNNILGDDIYGDTDPSN